MAMPPISQSPNDGSGTPSAPSRVSSGIPRAPLRSVRRPVPSPEPADQNTLNMLGSGPDESDLGNAPTGGAGFLMGSLAQAARGIQGLATGAPGFVPPEILMWLDNAMQQLPQLLQQQQSNFAAPPVPAGTTGIGTGTGAPPPPASPGVGMGAGA